MLFDAVQCAWVVSAEKVAKFHKRKPSVVTQVAPYHTARLYGSTLARFVIEHRRRHLVDGTEYVYRDVNERMYADCFRFILISIAHGR